MAMLASHVSRLVCTQSGSRFLQKELNKADSNFVEFILNDIGSNLAEIMVDTYGNYFCQKLVSCCSLKQSSRVLSMIQGDFTTICCDQKGTHTVQSILDSIELVHYEDFIMETLRGRVSFLSMVSQFLRNSRAFLNLGLRGYPCDLKIDQQA